MTSQSATTLLNDAGYLDGQDVVPERLAEPRVVQDDHRADELEQIILQDRVVWGRNRSPGSLVNLPLRHMW